MSSQRTRCSIHSRVFETLKGPRNAGRKSKTNEMRQDSLCMFRSWQDTPTQIRAKPYEEQSWGCECVCFALLSGASDDCRGWERPTKLINCKKDALQQD